MIEDKYQYYGAKVIFETIVETKDGWRKKVSYMLSDFVKLLKFDPYVTFPFMKQREAVKTTDLRVANIAEVRTRIEKVEIKITYKEI